jgi:O26-antigen biosynthesis N-acetyl-L-fucosamine transferase
MHFLLLSSTYYPEKKSASFMLNELSKSIISMGHKVTVITFSNDVKENYIYENINGAFVFKLKVSDPGFSKVNRAINELSYSRKIIKLLKKNVIRDIDGVIFFSPSIFFGRAVSYIKKTYCIQSYLILRDIFPDWLVKINQLNKGLIYYFFKVFEYTTLKNADFIGTESLADIEHVVRIRGNTEVDIQQLRNWLSEPEEEEYLSERDELISDSKLNLVYGGSLGLAQDLISFLKILEKQKYAKLLNLIIVGDGEQKTILEKFSKNSLMEISIIPMMERNDYFSLLKQSDGGLVVLDGGLEANNYPGKSFDYMYFKKPLICFLHENNEFGKLIDEENLGYFIRANNDQSLIDNLETLIFEKDDRDIRGEKAYQYLMKNFTVEIASKQIVKSFMIKN